MQVGDGVQVETEAQEQASEVDLKATREWWEDRRVHRCAPGYATASFEKKVEYVIVWEKTASALIWSCMWTGTDQRDEGVSGLVRFVLRQILPRTGDGRPHPEPMSSRATGSLGKRHVECEDGVPRWSGR